MKKITLAVFISLLVAPFGVQAATTDFTASAQITVSGVIIDTITGATIDMFIADTSTAESWDFDSGTFTVTNPGTFSVGSSDSAAASIKITNSGTQVSCTGNTTPGTTTATLPTTSGTYVVIPQSNACSSGGSVSPGGGGGGSSVPTTYQSYNPNTGDLTTDEDTTSTTQTPSADESVTTTSADENIVKVRADASSVATQTRAQVAQSAGKSIDATLETKYDSDIVARVVASQTSVATEVREKILTFVTYGTQTTEALGAGERGGVVNSFKEAFGKLPESESDWEDVVKIANGRWPSQINAERENTAEDNFKAIYLRAPDRANPNDDAAVVVMAYGLRSRNRNLNSEKVAIKTYQHIFKRDPVTATAWDAVRAIAYSGATR
ncbi:MAG: hypothetical protein CO042_04450 [Parcubacteria group bacterium CG_4_9_14_0_2_um_filter_41_8]|nr:MAG: hypothetical protein AUJ34_00440 [Parcubacteria group bacterium CG1_02_41_12]PIP67043.1 MAG: hypothetical protein COW93_02355 [Parcubacteria group bacterium CG22_combo_CG10-13_8_21_14_all_41_9]PIQ79122.1 MAG: hypothetical protein COV79_04290 [Parcubacteria group bacterium CG11_big_fil_rev_8_21_14_0_20_41_14]PIR57085.1 MAG: hypothetical protein COU72_02815 [Parcubacteria group bacterium CG10_big_fil_rev_8_21_14_0_10_41_35]PJC40309.1 MAG: hypothetical protein CO042_04450 [Parcubacteria gr